MPQAIPIVFTAAAAAASASTAGVLGTTLFTVLGTAVTVGKVVGAALSIAGSLLGAVLNRPPNVGEQSLQVRVPTVDARPPKRLALGYYRFGGRMIHRATQGRDYFATYLLASHPMALGQWVLHIDDRVVEAYTGDPFNPDQGAYITAPDSLAGGIFWISTGVDARPPTDWVERGLLSSTDRGDDLTVLFLRSQGIRAQDFSVKYPNAGNRQVQLRADGGRWRDPATQAEVYSPTPARISYALMRHPLGLNYAAEGIDAASFADAALIEESLIGGRPRYAMNGAIDLTGDRGDFVAAIQGAAAAQIVMQGGRWTYIPGVPRQSVMTLDDSHMVGPPSLNLTGDPEQRYNMAEGSFIDPTLYTAATNPLLRDDAAILTDGQEKMFQPQHPHVTEPGQAQQLDAFALRNSRMQKTLSAPFSGRAIFLSKGDIVTTNFVHLPLWRSGQCIVEKAQSRYIQSGDGVIEVNELTLRVYDPDAFEWSSADEQPYYSPASTSSGVNTHPLPPLPVVTFSGQGDTRAATLTLTGEAGLSLEWEASLNTGADWSPRQAVDIPASGSLSLGDSGLPSGADMRWRLRYAGGESLTGPWRETPDYVIPGASPIPAPSGAWQGSAAINWMIPNDPRIDALEIHRAAGTVETNPMEGVRVDRIPAVPNGSTTYTDTTGLADGYYRYWARCYGGLAAGEWSAPVDIPIA